MKKYMKDTHGLMTFGVGMGVASSLVPSGSLTPLTSKLPVMGSIIGSGMVLNEVSKLNKKVSKYNY